MTYWSVTMNDLIEEIKHRLSGIFFIIFLVGGVNHFINKDILVKMIPPYIPFNDEFIIYITGAFQLLLGVSILMPKYYKLASKGIMFFLLIVFPALIYISRYPDVLPGMSKEAIYFSVPLQLFLFGLAWWMSGMHSPMHFINNLISSDESFRDDDKEKDDEKKAS